ncbi:MAG: lipoprotein signal peptidase [Muribaculaceae bacterium]|nr:lipoprotein signal peptidase [Muribaculaceae bacterium]
MKQRKGMLALLLILLVILVDQAVKIYVKTHFYLGEDVEVFSWFHIFFVQNPGMAFGWEMGSKLALTLFRIAAIALGIYYLLKLRHADRKEPVGYVACIALIVAGAIGNVIDCLFYGLIFDNPMPPSVAVLFPEAGGYAPALHGMVVDMLYFPLCEWNWPQWMPWVGSEHFIFFHPVFNIADAAISVGIIAIILFYSRYLTADKPDAPVAESDDTEK